MLGGSAEREGDGESKESIFFEFGKDLSVICKIVEDLVESSLTRLVMVVFLSFMDENGDLLMYKCCVSVSWLKMDETWLVLMFYG